jgi:hypothetical protein
MSEQSSASKGSGFEDLIEQIDADMSELEEHSRLRQRNSAGTESNPPGISRGASIQDLIAEIDAQLLEQKEYRRLMRRNSVGTMFVDQDEDGNIEVSYRGSCHDDSTRKELSPPPLDITKELHVRHDRHATAEGEPRIYVEGYDPATAFEYDYDGTTMHLHKDSSRTSSQHSAYYSIHAENYSPNVPFFDPAATDTQVLPSTERKKRQKAVTFIQTILQRFDKTGLMKRFKEDRKKWKAQGKRIVMEKKLHWWDGSFLPEFPTK